MFGGGHQLSPDVHQDFAVSKINYNKRKYINKKRAKLEEKTLTADIKKFETQIRPEVSLQASQMTPQSFSARLVQYTRASHTRQYG